jgi:[acyl-carrier-protein] S-malonyltransferase
VSFAIVFSGQGTQHPGMLPWLTEDAIVRQTCLELGVSDWRAALGDDSWAERNLNAQLLLTGSALAAWQQIATSLPRPAAVAGYSVGELAAFSAAGIFDATAALGLARQRALAMDRCAAHSPGGLMSVTGPGADSLAQVCSAHRLDVAIRNGCFSAVVGGSAADLERAEKMLTAQGARCTRLRVGIRSHTPSMKPAADDFLRVLSEATFHRPVRVLFSNATSERVLDAGRCKDVLAAQIASTVKWADCMDAIRSRQPRCVLEIGPGQALARMWNERYADIPARSCDEFRSAAAVIRWVAEAAQ